MFLIIRVRKREKLLTFAGSSSTQLRFAASTRATIYSKRLHLTSPHLFLQKFKTMGSIRRKLQEELEVRSFVSGFKTEIFICQNNVACRVYYRDPLVVLREQVGQCHSHEFFFTVQRLHVIFRIL